MGDYPHLPDVPVERKDIYYPYDFPELRRNFQEPVSLFIAFKSLDDVQKKYLLLTNTNNLFRFMPKLIFMMKLALVLLQSCSFPVNTNISSLLESWAQCSSYTGGWTIRKCLDQFYQSSILAMVKFITHLKQNHKFERKNKI